MEQPQHSFEQLRRKDSRSKLQKESPSKNLTIDPHMFSGENLLDDDLNITDRNEKKRS